MKIRPITFKAACKFVAQHHRHNKPPRGHKFSLAIESAGTIVGVAMVGRPVARAFDNGLTAEVNRTCTDGTKNANSMLYGAAARACKAMGYERLITYTQADESGASLKAAGFRKVREIDARGSWAHHSVAQKAKREVGLFGDLEGAGGVERVLWEMTFTGPLAPPSA